MSTSDSDQSAEDWWSSGAGHSLVSGRPARLEGPTPSQPAPQYAPPGYSYSPYPYPPLTYGASAGGYPGMPQAVAPHGAGSLADPGSRLGARLLDAIFMIPVFVLAFVLSTSIIRPWQSIVVSQIGTSGGTRFSFGRFGLWIIVTFVFVLIGWTLYETLFTHLMGRTPGKAIVHIRPQWDGHLGTNLTFGRALARSVAYWSWGLVPYIGGILALIDVLSLLWNPRRQCWHDRICSTVVVNDR